MEQKKIFERWQGWQIMAMVGMGVFPALALWSSLHRDFDHDEFEALHAAWLVYPGRTIYIDFFQHHHFLLYYLLSPLFGLFGEGIGVIVVARMVSLVFLTGIVFMTLKIAQSAYNKRTGYFAAFLLLTTFMFVDKAIEIRPDVPFVFIALISVWFFLRYREQRVLWYLAASAVALFVAFLFLQKAVFFGLIIGLVFLYESYRRRFGWKEYVVFGGVFGVLLAGFIGYVSAMFGWSEYFFLNWELNTRLLNGFPFYKYLLRSMVQSPFFWLLFVGGLVIMIKQRVFSVVVLFAISLLGSILLVKSPFPQYYLMSLPFVAIVAATALSYFSERFVRIVPMLMLVSILWSVGSVWYMWQGNERQLAKVAYVLKLTEADDLVYDGDAQFNVFRNDLDYFWFSVKPKTGNLTAYRMTHPYEYDPYTLIREKQPEIISNSFLKMKQSPIPEQYVPSELFPELYIRKQ